MKTPTAKSMSGIDICRMMKRRLKAAGLPEQFSPHSFRVATVTDLPGQNVPLEDVQHLAGQRRPAHHSAAWPPEKEAHPQHRRTEFDLTAIILVQQV